MGGMRIFITSLVFSIALGACGDETTSQDSGIDSGRPFDGSVGDVALADAGPDAHFDANTPDASTSPDASSPDSGVEPPADPRGAPELSEFEVRPNEPHDRIYFRSSESIEAEGTEGFFLSDGLRKQIVGVVINAGSTHGHYFEVDEALDYWDTYALRYEGGSSLRDVEGNELYPFWLVEVDNRIPQPAPSGTPYFVRTTGSDSNDGLSHESAFQTITHALSLQARTIYVEAGDYGAEQLAFDYEGTATEPIVVQGYRTQSAGVPTAINDVYWEWGAYGTGLDVHLDLSELPTLTGTPELRRDRRGGAAFEMPDFCIVKNFQVESYNTGFHIRNADHIVLENIVSVHTGSLEDGTGGAIAVVGGQGQGTDMYNKFINIVTAQGINMVRLYGGGSLFENIRVYNDGASRTPDYFISIYEGSNNVIRSCVVDKIGGGRPGAHGIGFKSWDFVTEYNLITDSTTVNMFGAIELRHDHVRNNVVRRVLAYGRPGDEYATMQTNAVVIRDNASANLVEDCTFTRVHRGIYFTDQPGEQGRQTPGFDNVFRNIVIYDTIYALGTTGPTDMPLVYGNVFQNLTIDRCRRVFWTNGARIFNDANDLINSTVTRCEGLGNTEIVQTSNNYADNDFSAPSGESIQEVQPMFTDPEAGDYSLQPSSPLAGSSVDANNHYDHAGIERIEDSLGAHTLR